MEDKAPKNGLISVIYLKLYTLINEQERQEVFRTFGASQLRGVLKPLPVLECPGLLVSVASAPSRCGSPKGMLTAIIVIPAVGSPARQKNRGQSGGCFPRSQL